MMAKFFLEVTVEMKMMQDYGSFYMLFYLFAMLINFCWQGKPVGCYFYC